MITEALLRTLADGESHSGEDLARCFGVTRAAVCKHVRKLRDWGLPVQAVPGRGYALDAPLRLLDETELRERAARSAAFDLDRLDVFLELDSTNRFLLDYPPSRSAALRACLAEYQSAGRGRRGRKWTAPLGSGLCLSLGWQFADNPDQLNGLTLAVGVMIRRVIERCLGIEIGLKWPNDLVWDGRKLGGVLVELNAESQGHCLVVVGVGLNTAMPSDGFAGLSDWPLGAVDLGVAAGGPVIDRQELAAELIDEIGRLLARYLQTGFSPYIDEWRAGDYLEGRRVRLSDGQGRATGIAAGIAEDAALLIRMAGGELRRVVSGDVSVRLSR